MKRIGLYCNTLRYLRPAQIFGRVRYRLARPRPDFGPHPARATARGLPTQFAWRHPSLVSPGKFRFLGQTGSIANAADWHDSSQSALWLYNAHYFDDLGAAGAEDRRDWHSDLVARWIAENPAPAGIGWAPYPSSLRIVNWIFWMLRNEDAVSPAMLQSLAVQVRYLAGRLEHHILGNHLLANAKALVFAGRFFAGDEADHWYKTGMALLVREFGEQILADGGHFERSPMYHNIVLTDLLDLLNIHDTYGMQPPDSWRGYARSMLAWAAAMTHPDGEISFFNDAAFDIAPNLAQLHSYAERLGLTIPSALGDEIIALPQSGYVRLSNGSATILADIAPVGPDYLPAHGHADTLSFELSLGTYRVVVNGGTSLYGTGPERLRQRGTASHSTLMLDDKNSSEVWSGFRVARRARITAAEWSHSELGPSATGQHDGYVHLPGRPLHRREWTLRADRLVISDAVAGGGEHVAAILFHLSPQITAGRADGGDVILSDRHTGKLIARARSDAPERLSITPSSWHPRFGEDINTSCIRIDLTGTLPMWHVMTLTWEPS